MTTALVPLVLIGVLTSCGVYLLLERNLTRMLMGLLLIGNAINLLILTVGGASGNPPIFGRTSAGRSNTADPLVQGMILTAIVISMGVAAFVLALAYRSYRLTTEEEVADDPEDTRVSHQTEDEADEDVVPVEPDRGADEPAALDALPPHSKEAQQRREAMSKSTAADGEEQ
jgi:multicomponent Na+:H+ antiporter subunit C